MTGRAITVGGCGTPRAINDLKVNLSHACQLSAIPPVTIRPIQIKMERIADKDPWIQQQYAIHEVCAILAALARPPTLVSGDLTRHAFSFIQIKRNGAALRDHIHEEHGERARTLHLAGAGDMSLKLEVRPTPPPRKAFLPKSFSFRPMTRA